MVALATVTIHGKPYEFIIDTGASVSVLDEQIASSIGLAHVGKPGQSTGVGCSAPSHPIRLDDWKIGGEALPTAVVLATKVDLAGEKYKGVTVAGLLGAEVYRAFGSLRLDYKAGSMTLGGNPRGGTGFFPVVLAGARGQTELVATVKLHGQRGGMLVDTGASHTLVDTSIADRLKLTKIGAATKLGSVSCVTSAQPVTIDQLTVGSVSFPSVTGVSTANSITKQSNGAIIGLLGSDLMSGYGVVTLDYATRTVTLGG